MMRPSERLLNILLFSLFAAAVIFGVLHGVYQDWQVGGVEWFNLDRERNFPTWFSGFVLFLMGCSSVVAYYWEKKRLAEGVKHFKLPVLWLGVAFLSFLMSLDEMTALHENICWREIRQFSASKGGGFEHVTQWQILFIPLLLIIFSYFAVFFLNRFASSARMRFWGLSGLGCLLFSIALEGLRNWFKHHGHDFYSAQVLGEELLEMFGMLFIFGAIQFYVKDISNSSAGLNPKRLPVGPAFFTRKSAGALLILFVAFTLLALLAYKTAASLSKKGVGAPKLFDQALRSNLKETNEKSVVWFENVEGVGNTLTFEQGAQMVRSAHLALKSPGETAHSWPLDLSNDQAPRIAFLSVTTGKSRARVFSGTGLGYTKALEQSIVKARKVFKNSQKNLWVKLDIVSEVRVAASNNPDDFEGLSFGLEGIATGKPSPSALIPEVLSSRGYISSAGRPTSKLTEWISNRKEAQNIFRFKTKSYFSDKDTVVELYRGHRVYDQLSREILMDSAKRAGEYLVRNTDENGRFNYIYKPEVNRVINSYNVVRHAGTLYSMMELYEAAPDPELLSAATRAISHLLSYARPVETRLGNALAIVDGTSVKLGANALTVVALSKYMQVTGDRKEADKLIKLGLYIRDSQLESGEFICKREHPSGNQIPFQSEYYPGEAILAMVRLYEHDPQPYWLDSAQKATDFLIHVRDKGLATEKLIHDHWLIMGLNALAEHRPDASHTQHALRIAEAIMKSQIQHSAIEDYIGGWGEPPRATPAATRSEGLIAAYRIAERQGMNDFKIKVMDSLGKAVKFQLGNQFGSESSMYMPFPKKSIGAYRRSHLSYETRIDYSQHNISSLIGLCSILNKLED